MRLPVFRSNRDEGHFLVEPQTKGKRNTCQRMQLTLDSDKTGEILYFGNVSSSFNITAYRQTPIHHLQTTAQTRSQTDPDTRSRHLGILPVSIDEFLQKITHTQATALMPICYIYAAITIKANNIINIPVLGAPVGETKIVVGSHHAFPSQSPSFVKRPTWLLT